MAPSILHILSEVLALTTDQDIKNMILANYSDIPSTTEAAARLQGMQTSPTEPLVTFNYRYEAIHRVAFALAPNEQYNKTVIVEYTKKLPQNARDKLLRKIAKRDSYIRTLDYCIIGQQTNVAWNALVSNETNEDVCMYT